MPKKIDDVLFRKKVPWIMGKLIKDFPIQIIDAAAICGNLGHECGGFYLFQEQKPLVPGSKGGFGWAQWTGTRRRQFEAYVKRLKLDPKSDEANYDFLVWELKNTETSAIPAVKKATNLRDKVIAFEMAFERAGIKHYDSRVVWAQRAMDEWGKIARASKSSEAKPVETPPAAPSQPASTQPQAKQTSPIAVAIAGLIAAVIAVGSAIVGWVTDLFGFGAGP